MSGIRIIEGDLSAPKGAKVAIVVGRFNGFIVESLLAGCIDTLRRHGVAEDALTVVKVPKASSIFCISETVRLVSLPRR